VEQEFVSSNALTSYYRHFTFRIARLVPAGIWINQSINPSICTHVYAYVVGTVESQHLALNHIPYPVVGDQDRDPVTVGEVLREATLTLF